MDRVGFFEEAFFQVLDEIQVFRPGKLFLRSASSDSDPEFAFDVRPRPGVQREKLPGPYPVEPHREVPRDAGNLHGPVERGHEVGRIVAGVRIGAPDRTLEDVPKGIDISGPAVLFVSVKEGFEVIEFRNALKGCGDRFRDAEKRRELRGDRGSFFVAYSPVECPDDRKRADVPGNPPGSVAIFVVEVGKFPVFFHHSGDPGEEFRTPVAVRQKPVGDRGHELRPFERGPDWSPVAETFLPVGVVPEPRQILRRIVKGEVDEGLGIPVLRLDLPYEPDACEEIPFPKSFQFG